MAYKYCLDSNPDLPSRLEFGWENKSDRLIPILTDKPPVPEATIEMFFCLAKR